MEQRERSAEEADALRVLGLARRAGRVVVGSDAVRAASRQGKVAVIVVARDVGESARRRLRSALRATPTFECGTMEELGAAVGRGRVVVVAVTDSGLARRAVDGLEGYRPESPVRARA
jgi:ribosomal protein L7Ae-like RNA K-turn-binding protein